MLSVAHLLAEWYTHSISMEPIAWFWNILDMWTLISQTHVAQWVVLQKFRSLVQSLALPISFRVWWYSLQQGLFTTDHCFDILSCGKAASGLRNVTPGNCLNGAERHFQQYLSCITASAPIHAFLEFFLTSTPHNILSKQHNHCRNNRVVRGMNPVPMTIINP